MEDLLTRLASLSHWEIALMATYLLYQGAFVAVFPEEIIITTLGFLWGQGRIGFLEAVVAIWIGLLPANATTVFFGSRLGPGIFLRRPFRWVFKKEVVDDALGMVQRYGHWIIFITRFTPVIRGPVYLAAGLSKMGVLNFIRTDLIAAFFQVPLLLTIGREIGKNSASLVDAYKKLGLFMAIVLVASVGVKLFLSWRKRLNASVTQPLEQPLPIQSPIQYKSKLE